MGMLRLNRCLVALLIIVSASVHSASTRDRQRSHSHPQATLYQTRPMTLENRNPGVQSPLVRSPQSPPQYQQQQQQQPVLQQQTLQQPAMQNLMMPQQSVMTNNPNVAKPTMADAEWMRSAPQNLYPGPRWARQAVGPYYNAPEASLNYGQYNPSAAQNTYQNMQVLPYYPSGVNMQMVPNMQPRQIMFPGNVGAQVAHQPHYQHLSIDPNNYPYIGFDANMEPCIMEMPMPGLPNYPFVGAPQIQNPPGQYFEGMNNQIQGSYYGAPGQVFPGMAGREVTNFGQALPLSGQPQQLQESSNPWIRQVQARSKKSDNQEPKIMVTY